MIANTVVENQKMNYPRSVGVTLDLMKNGWWIVDTGDVDEENSSFHHSSEKKNEIMLRNEHNKTQSSQC